MVQWLRIRLPTQGARVRSLVRELRSCIALIAQPKIKFSLSYIPVCHYGIKKLKWIAHLYLCQTTLSDSQKGKKSNAENIKPKCLKGQAGNMNK